MAPFLTHLMVGEHVWAGLNSHARWAGSTPPDGRYGIFLFGCLAPDVDKFCDGLEQGTTHFVAKDDGFAWVDRRTRRFLDRPAGFLRAPFPDIAPAEQAFVLGYLCHVATDEVTGRLARRTAERLQATGRPWPQVDALLTAMDPRLWALARDPGEVVAALAAARIPGGTFPFAPADCLQALHQVVLPQVRDGGGLLPYLGMLRRHWQWRRHGRVSDARDDPGLERDLETHRRRVEAGLAEAELLVDELDVELFAREAVEHSSRCIEALLAEENTG
ncbi:MAG: zinc dependent phospholipase C family protein [Anaerolineae bacterium]